MAGVLITGFEPFGGETVNPSWEVVKQLDGMIIRGQQVVAKQLPCVFGEALTVLKAALETAGWDGSYYRRGYYDDGTPLGSRGNAECRIDLVAQSWAVLSGAAEPHRARVLGAEVDVGDRGGRNQHLAAEGSGNLRHSAANRTGADYAEGLAEKLKAYQAILRSCLPAACITGNDVADNADSQTEGHTVVIAFLDN